MATAGFARTLALSTSSVNEESSWLFEDNERRKHGRTLLWSFIHGITMDTFWSVDSVMVAEDPNILNGGASQNDSSDAISVSENLACVDIQNTSPQKIIHQKSIGTYVIPMSDWFSSISEFLKKGYCGCLNPTGKEMMKYLVRYVIGKPFPRKHNVMEVDYRYRIKMLTPSEIFESTEVAKKNTRNLITFQYLKRANFLASKAVPGIWKPTGKVKSIFDGKKRHMGNVKISWYCYYG